jgi:hypothetical protein
LISPSRVHILTSIALCGSEIRSKPISEPPTLSGFFKKAITNSQPMIKSSTVERALQLLYRRAGIVLWSILHDRGIISQIPLEVNKSFVINCI